MDVDRCMGVKRCKCSPGVLDICYLVDDELMMACVVVFSCVFYIKLNHMCVVYI